MHPLVGKIGLTASLLVSSLVNAQMQHEVEATNQSNHTTIINYQDIGQKSSAILHPKTPINLSIDEGSSITVMAPNGKSVEITNWSGGNVGSINLKTQKTFIKSI